MVTLSHLVPPLIDHRHVNVVHKHCHLPTSWRAIRAAHTLVNIAFNGSLREISKQQTHKQSNHYMCFSEKSKQTNKQTRNETVTITGKSKQTRISRLWVMELSKKLTASWEVANKRQLCIVDTCKWINKQYWKEQICGYTLSPSYSLQGNTWKWSGCVAEEKLSPLLRCSSILYLDM